MAPAAEQKELSPHARAEAEPQAPPSTGRRKPLSLPPPAKDATETSSAGAAAGDSSRPADDRAAGVAAALSAMHAAAAALVKPSARATASATEEKASFANAPAGRTHAAAGPCMNENPLPSVHGLRDPITRPAVARLLRAHLSAPLPESDQMLECERPILDCLQSDPSEVMRVANERIHVFPFKDVRKCWLRAWVEGSLWRAVEVFEGKGEQSDWLAEVVRLVDMALILAGGVGREIVCEWIFAVLERMLEQESEPHQRPAKRRKLAREDGGDRNDGASGWNIPDTFPSSIIHAPPLRHPIPRHHNLSLEAFQAHLDNAADLQESTLEGLPGDLPQPIIITGTLNHWPAISDPAREWSNPHYLMRKTLGGRRLVPIEIGRSYTDDDWGQNIITFGEFMRKYMFHHSDDNEAGRNDTFKEGKKTQSELNPNADGQESTKTPDDATTTDSDDHDSNPSTTTSQPGYLAQHDLFAQIPSLRADIAIPDHCYATPAPSPSPVTKNATPPLPPGHPSFPLLNAWFGPAGTISPLHTDPYHNILAQVVGSKYVRLYPPRQRDRGLYPRGVGDDGVDMGNTSEVDVGEAMAVLEGWEWSSLADRERRDAELSKEEAWAREEDLKMRRFDFEERFPRFREVEGCREALLGPDECLYVPKGWWHYVRSLTPSFSVSFWWD